MNKLSKMLILGAFLGTGVSFGHFTDISFYKFRNWLGGNYTEQEAREKYDILRRYSMKPANEQTDRFKNAEIAALERSMRWNDYTVHSEAMRQLGQRQHARKLHGEAMAELEQRWPEIQKDLQKKRELAQKREQERIWGVNPEDIWDEEAR